MQILNKNPRTPTIRATQCATPSPTPPRRSVAQVQSVPVKIEPSDLNSTTATIKSERIVKEFSAQSRQGVATEGHCGQVFKPVACAHITPKHDLTDQQDMKPLASRPLPVPAPKVAIPVAMTKLPSPASSSQTAVLRRNPHVKWIGYGCPQFTDVPECDGPSGVHTFSSAGTNQHNRRFRCHACGWSCSERWP